MTDFTIARYVKSRTATESNTGMDGRPVTRMDDLISRQAATDAVRKAKDKSEAHRMLMQLPSAQRWIPCSAEMPPTGKDVLVTLEGGTVTDGERWEPQEGKWFLFGGGVNGLDEDILAWMPLPEPWKGEKK